VGVCVGVCVVCVCGVCVFVCGVSVWGVCGVCGVVFVFVRGVVCVVWCV